MASKKPAHQWETRQHRAVRRDWLPEDFQGQPRAEAFDLHFDDGRQGEAVLGLESQRVDEVAASDPDLAFAVQAWLIARGQRRIDLTVRQPAGSWQPLLQGEIEARQLSDAVTSPPRRVITLCPSNAEMVHALGAFDRVVACEDSSDFPPEVAALPRLGPDLGPDLERVKELQPDLVISSLSVPGMERNVTGLRARGVPQLVLAPRSIDDVLTECLLLAEALGVGDAGERVVNDMREQMRALREAHSGPPARVYLEWWPKPMFTPGEACYSNALIELAGGQNVFGQRPGSSLQIEPDELLKADPDVCFVSWCGVALDKLDPDHLVKRSGLEHLRAARARRVYPLDERFSGRPGPRMLEAARVMADAIRRARAD